MIKKRSNDDPKFRQLIAFIDLVFNMMLAFSFLFILSFINIKITETNKDAKIDPKAEALVVLTWPDYAVEDLDLWMLMPDGSHVSFQNKNSGLATLERDDRGLYGDFSFTEGQMTVSTEINREVITLRALVPGEYNVSVHYFSNMNGPEQWARYQNVPDKVKTAAVPPYKAKIQIIQLNPVYKELATKDVLIEKQGAESPAIRFVITPDKKFGEIDTANPKPFIINTATGSPGYRGGP